MYNFYIFCLDLPPLDVCISDKCIEVYFRLQLKWNLQLSKSYRNVIFVVDRSVHLARKNKPEFDLYVSPSFVGVDMTTNKINLNKFMAV
jgi:hypothetical protein